MSNTISKIKRKIASVGFNFRTWYKIITPIILLIMTILQPCLANAGTIAANPLRLLISEVRGGDYAHAGDVEAVNLVLEKLHSVNPHLKSSKILDVGCGFGGTLDYLKNKGFEHLYGIDIDKTAINYAKQRYKNIQFDTIDALTSDTIFPKSTFGLILLFNSIYAIEDKNKLLSSLARIAKDGAILVIFDYSVPENGGALSVYDFAGKTMLPIKIQNLRRDLDSSGWDIIETDDLSDDFIKWYSSFLVKLRSKKDLLIGRFSEKDYKQVEDTFLYFLNQLKTRHVGGAAIYAKKR